MMADRLANFISRIAVVGASGTQGRFIVDSLLQGKKHVVTAITRTESTAKFPSAVQVAKVDYDNHQSLFDALKRQQALIITLNRTAGGAQEKLINAAADAGVQWVVPNEWGPDFVQQPELGKDCLLGPRLQSTRQHIERRGMHWIGMICSYWYQHSIVNANSFGFDLEEKKATFFDDGETKISVSTWAEVGRAVAALFSLPISSGEENGGEPCLTHWKNRDCYCASFCLSQKDMLASLLRVNGQEASDWTIGFEKARERFERGQEVWSTGDPEGLRMLIYARVMFKDGGGDLTAKLDNEKLGLPTENLDDATRDAIRLFEEGYNASRG